MERTVEQPIIADTSALVSLATKTDHNHVPATKAAAELREAQRPIILPSDVLVETVNILGKRSSHEIALKAVDALLKPGRQFILVEMTSHVEAALAKFKEQPEAVGLTDCIVMALADHYSTKDIFGFDKQFEDAGYHKVVREDGADGHRED
jgi:predicted nucleic acid-binding protein